MGHEMYHRVSIFVNFGFGTVHLAFWSKCVEKLLRELTSKTRRTLGLCFPIPHDARIATGRIYRGHIDGYPVVLTSSVCDEEKGGQPRICSKQRINRTFLIREDSQVGVLSRCQQK